VQRIRRMSLVLVCLGVLGLAACTQQEPEIAVEDQVPAGQRPADDPADGEAAPDDEIAETVELIAGDIYYENEPSQLPVGTIRFTLENEGNLPHDLVLEDLGDRTIVDELDGGESGEGDVSLEAGEYTFYCSVPGHRQAGMEFTVTVG
jgi:plastocyanin